MKKNIIIGISNLTANSIGVSLVNLLNTVDYTKYNVDLVFVNSVSYMLNQIPRSINVINSPFGGVKLGFFDKLKLRNKYDFALMYDVGSVELSSYIRSCSKNNAIYIHRNYRSIYVVSKTYDDFILANKIFEFKKILFANKPIQESFIKLHPQAEKKSYLLNYVIDDKRIINLSKANIEVNKPDHKVLFITAGSLNDRAKNYTLMIKMMSGLTKLNNHVELWILGDGPDLVNLKMLVNSLNLNNYVKFLGFKGNPYPYMAVADYFINTSDYFDFSTALAEARVLQKPIISTNIDEVNNNTYIISSDPNKIVSDVNELLNKKITYQGNNNFWVENQRILKTLDTIITTK